MPQGWEMMPWYGMIFGPIMMIVMLAIVVTIVVLLVRWLGGGFSSPGGTADLPLRRIRGTALEILEERFAKGEIEKEEFVEKKRLLSE
jgi:putative membrane protein